jgi:hypothetical protein
MDRWPEARGGTMDEDEIARGEDAERQEPAIELGFDLTETDVEERVREHAEAMWKLR